jgi:MarR family 2-MHQ and catechol resistance regulon transcriptional repressor
MQRFVEDEDGHVYEASVRAAVAQLREFFPEIDATSLEAHIVLERTHSLLLNMREAAWASFGLTGRRFILLRLLYTSDRRRLSMGEIASQMNLGTNNVTQLVDGMERDGLVHRVTGPEDKRVVFATLTPQGEELFASVFPRNAQRIEDSWSALTEDEKKTLTQLLVRLRVHLLNDESGARADALVAAAGADASKTSGPPR